MNGNGCTTATDMDTAPDSLSDPAAEKDVASTLSTMIPAAVVGNGGIDTDTNHDGIPHDGSDAEQIAAWAARQLASPVSLQSLRAVYDELVDRQHHNQAQYRISSSEPQQRDQPEPQNRQLRSLRLTCRILLAIHQQQQLQQPPEHQQHQQQQLMTTSQLSSIETTERRCRWLLELVTHAADDPNSVPVVGSDSGTNAATGNSDGVITNLCRHPVFQSSGPTEWTYDYVAGTNVADDGIFPTRAQFATEAKNLRDGPGYQNEYSDDGEDENDGDGNMLPSKAELAAEERMLWRMADTPIPTEP
jgi:hypothetical protein